MYYFHDYYLLLMDLVFTNLSHYPNSPPTVSTYPPSSPVLRTCDVWLVLLAIVLYQTSYNSVLQ